MDKQALVNFFLSSKKFSPETLEDIIGQFAPKYYGKHSLVLKEGKVADEYIFLESGCLRSFAHDLEGNEVTTELYTPGQVVFEVASFFNRLPSHENIMAMTDSKGWFISYAQLNELFHSKQEFREFGRLVLVKGFASLKNRMLSMIKNSAEERYLQLVAHRPEIIQVVPLKYIASYLGITDTSLSRIRKDFIAKKL